MELNPVQSLRHTQTPSLADWYADPMTPAQAQSIIDVARDGFRQACVTGRPSPYYRFMTLIGRYWLVGNVEMQFEVMMATASDDRQGALLQLIYGQLLLSRKRRDAFSYLDSGFLRATQWLAAPDYLRVLKQHELLRYLTLSHNPAPAMDLKSLIAEARVIRCLVGGTRQRSVCAGSTDTVG
jgi:hypothetical protein